MAEIRMTETPTKKGMISFNNKRYWNNICIVKLFTYAQEEYPTDRRACDADDCYGIVYYLLEMYKEHQNQSRLEIQFSNQYWT